jgi:RND family efflux transporter MFP subunit
MKGKNVIISIVIAVLVLAILLLIFHRHKSVSRPTTEIVEKTIAVTTLHKKDVNDFFEAAGLIQAKTISVISSRIMGAVTDVLVNQGDKVAAGQELLLIDNNDLRERMKAAQASYNEATKSMETAKSNRTLADTTYSRHKQLYDEKAISGQEMDQMTNQKDRAVLDFQRAQASVEAAKANLRQAKINLDFSRIISPIDGVVTHKNIDKGSMATPGTPLMTVEDNADYKVETSIDESMANQVNVSMPVDVAVDSISKTFKGIVNEIVPSIDASSRTFVVKAMITQDPNEHLLTNGLYARVLIPQKKKSILAVPAAAIVRKGQLAGVYVVGEENRLSYRMIRTGKTFGNDIEVLAGLNEDERIVAGDTGTVSEGETIGIEND